MIKSLAEGLKDQDYKNQRAPLTTIWRRLLKFSSVVFLWNVMAHTQKSNFVFQRNGRVTHEQEAQIAWIAYCFLA